MTLKQFEQKTMKKNILLLIAVAIVLLAAVNVKAQGKVRGHKADSSKSLFFNTSSTAFSTLKVSNYAFYGAPDQLTFPKNADYHYISFNNQWGKWAIDAPDSLHNVVIHINRNNLKWINDSTAVYNYFKK